MVVDVQLLRDRVYPRSTGEAFGYLLEVSHPALGDDDPMRVTDIDGEWDDELETFVLQARGYQWITLPVTVTPPGQSDEDPEGALEVPNIDRRIGRALKLMRTAAEVTITPVLRSNPEVSMAEPYGGLELRNVETSGLSSSGDLVLSDLETEPFCTESVTETRFPAVFRAMP